MLRPDFVHIGAVVFAATSAAAFFSEAISGDTIDVQITSPTFDQWNYPFASNPGGNPYAAVFAPYDENGFHPDFDNRDGQMTLGFDTHAAGFLSISDYGDTKWSRRASRSCSKAKTPFATTRRLTRTTSGCR